ncbi:hypothetical protein LJB76_00185 [Clostridia bacterium OttesenSCG-928-O13]|nr:hypothetical protein [Clostridia bacterium OttesenSCG-928-O13]
MNKNEFIGYEYLDVSVKQSVASLCVDGYENFGWSLENTAYPAERLDSVTLRFKRDRRLRHKAELTRLQHQFNGQLKEVARLEAAKTGKAMIAAMAIGVVGTAFMAGAVFAMVGGMLPLGIALAIPGTVGWALPYLVFQKLGRVTAQQVTPLLEEKHDELYNICEKANGLLAM